MDEQGNDFIVSELISELKAENIRKDKLNRGFLKVIAGLGLIIVAVVVSFLLYLNQYDYISTENVSASGVYTLIDSEGNVIAQDLTSEEIDAIMEGHYGNCKTVENQSEG